MPTPHDLDDAYANSANIPGGEAYFARWAQDALAFRARHEDQQLGVAYGGDPRQVFDMYFPKAPAKGTVVFVHGGYWLAGSPRDFSHLAQGALAVGYAFAMPSYRLAPDVRIADITRDIAGAVAAIAARTTGPIYLCGHSAGGHLVARLACTDMAAGWSARVARVLAISPLSDLAPLMRTRMNDTLCLDWAEVAAESPIRLACQDIPVTALVGGAERPVFLDQAGWLRQAWGCDLTVLAGLHHFDVIDGFLDATSPLMRALFARP